MSKHKINVAGDPAAGNYTLRFDLFEAAELRTKAKLAIEVSIGAWRVESKKVSVEVCYFILFLFYFYVLFTFFFF